MKKIIIAELPRPLYSLKNPYVNRHSILFSGYTKSMIDKKNTEILSQKNIEFGGDKYLINKLTGDTKTVIFPSLWEYNFMRTKYIAKMLKMNNPDISIIVSGPEVTQNNKEELLDFPFDFAEGHMFSFNILNRLIQNRELSSLSSWESDETKKVFYPPASKTFSFKHITSPYLSGHLNSCFDYKIITTELKRGCLGNCLYCGGALLKTGEDSLRNIDEIKKELELFIEKGINVVKWWDGAINTPKEQFYNLCKVIKKNRFDKYLEFEASIDISSIDKETIKHLIDCNFSLLSIGLQTSNEEVLRKIGRPYNTQKWLSGINLLNEAGLKYNIDIILGLPFDNLISYKNTVNFLIEENLVNSTNVFPLMIDPASKLYETAESKKIKYQKSPPHLILSSQGFSFEELREGINYSIKSGADIILQPYRKNNHIHFADYFHKPDFSLNCENNNDLPITKIILDMDSKIFNSDDFYETLHLLKEKLANTVAVWFFADSLGLKQKMINDILKKLSFPNPFTIWNIILETKKFDITPDFIDNITASINYLPTKLDYDSIYLAKEPENEFLRTSTRIFLLVNPDNNYNSFKGVNVYLNTPYEMEDFSKFKADGYLFDLPFSISKDNAISQISKIHKANWQKKVILFKNLYHQTIYDYYFNNIGDIEGYEENIFEIKSNKITQKTFSEKFIDGNFKALRRIRNKVN